MASEFESGSSPTTQQPTTNNLNRRSLSIFSRRGTETPIPATQTLALASMSMAFAPPPSATGPNGKAKRWRLSKDVKIPEGTILRMVPKEAPVVEMTPLEREMATSPNEEILRSIGMSSGHESAPVSPVQGLSSNPLADITNTGSPRRYYSRRERKNSQSDVIGFWRDGKAQWESNGPAGNVTENDGRPKTAGRTESSPPSIFQVSRADRPKIQVAIPENPSARRPFSFVPFFSRSVSELPPKGIIVSHTISQDVSPPSVSSHFSIESFQVSATSPPTVLHKPIPHRSYLPVNLPIEEGSDFSETLIPERLPHASNSSHSSNSSNSGSDGEDNTSQSRSNRSSMTSLGEHPTALASKKSDRQSRKSRSSSIASIQQDDGFERREIQTSIGSPIQPIELEGSPIAENLRMGDLAAMMRSSSVQRPHNGRRRSSVRGNNMLARIDSKEELQTNVLPSPTLSEAERSLEAQLTNIPEHWSKGAHGNMQSPVPKILLSPARAPPPPPPRRSSKRKVTVAKPEVISDAFSAAMDATQNARKLRQKQLAEMQQVAMAQSKLRRHDSVRSILSLVFEDDEIQPVDAQAAEAIVFHILSGLQTMQDLFNTAVITKGFYRVFKVNELRLTRQVLQNMCPAAWEYRETCRPNEDEDDLYSPAPQIDYTPATYIQSHKSDARVIDTLKQLLLERCQSLLRSETVAQLSSDSPFTSSSRADSALWRIWTFCRIFGCDKNREDDLIAQMDWLRGGILAHQASCTSTISTSDSFYVSSVLLGAPDHFAKGNQGGLNAEELYDMLEMWNCLSSLTVSLIGRTEQARQFGLYDYTDVQGGDIDGEETMLEEWHKYILTLGLSPILDLAVALNTDSASAFALAQHNGWTRWTPPCQQGTCNTFFREAVSRLYEEKICETFSPEQNRLQEMRSIRRAHRPSFASERQRKLSATNSVRSCISEKPLSGWEGVMDRLKDPQTSGHQGPFESSSSAPTTVVRRANTIARKPVRPPPPPPPQRAAPSPPMAMHPAFQGGDYNPSYEDELPAYEGRPASWSRHPLQQAMYDENPGAHSAEKAVFRIVEMGFTPEEAKGALKITDMGDGLRVDRAVELLLRQKEQAY